MAAILSGISIPREPEFAYPSRNCTWPPFDSLGVCSSCEDIKADLRPSCWLPVPNTDLVQSCNYTVRAGWTLSAKVNVSPEGQTTGTTLNATRPGIASVTTDSNNYNITILRIGQDQYNAMSRHSKLEELDVSLYDCSFSFCRKTYAETTVVNGVLREPTPVQHQFLLNQTLNFQVSLKSCDMWPGEEARLMTLRPFRVFLGEANSPDNTAHIEELFKVCPDIKAISKNTSSYITTNYETDMIM